MTPFEFSTVIQKYWKIIQSNPIKEKTYRLYIKKKHEGLSLLEVYCQNFPHIPASHWAAKISSGNLLLNGFKSTRNTVVKAGNITTHTEKPTPEPTVNIKIDLLYANSHLWVLNKPAPLPVHAGGRYHKNTLVNLLKTAFPLKNIHLINRLDANTTGLILIALDQETARHLSQQFENRSITKTYLALVEGKPVEKKFNSSASISKEKTASGGRTIQSGFKANTDFELLQEFENTSLLKVIPSSGRTNQIRLHLANIHLPIVGDLGYKNPKYFDNNPLTYPTDSLFLHAWKLKFIHPNNGKEIKIKAPLNEKWRSDISFKL